MDCFTCVTCNVPLHPGDEFGLKEDLIFCRHHFFEQQQQLTSLQLLPPPHPHLQHHQQQQQSSYDPHFSIENPSISHVNPMASGFLDDSGYYTSPIPTLIPSNPSINTSTSGGTSTQMVKRTRKRKERQQQVHQQDEMMSSSDHFLTLSPSTSNMGMFFQLEPLVFIND